MDIPKAQKAHDSHFDWEKFSRSVIESYGSFESPDYSFAKVYFSKEKYPDVIRFLAKNYDFSEDTEPNTDVSYGYFFEGWRCEFHIPGINCWSVLLFVGIVVGRKSKIAEHRFSINRLYVPVDKSHEGDWYDFYFS